MTAREIVGDITINLPSDPHVLMIGEEFDLSSEENLRILKLKWNLILTSSSDEELLAQITKSLPSYREVREIRDISPDDSYKPDSKNLKLIRLFGSGEANTGIGRRIAQKLALDVAGSIWNRTLRYGGRFVVVGYTEGDAFSFEKMSELLSSCPQRENEAVFFGVDEAMSDKLDALGEEIAEYRSRGGILCSYSESLGALLEPMAGDGEDEAPGADFTNFGRTKLKIFINGKPCFINRADVVKLSTFATLLNDEELNRVYVPPQYVESYFSKFLEQSASTPEWYGYKEGFNLLRDYEELLLEKTYGGLNNPGAMEGQNAPVCLKGESGSGKSVAAANLAYRVYNKKQYPVIFIDNRSLKVFESYPENLSTLNEVLQLLEGEGARCTLIVWDLSMFESDAGQFMRIYSTLKNTWFRNVQFAVTAYENIDTDKNGGLQYVPAQMGLSKDAPEGREHSELDRLRTILKRKARWDAEEIGQAMGSLSQSEEMRRSFMVILHKLFRDTRPNIENSMRTYVSGNLRNAIFGRGDAFDSERMFKTSFQLALERVRGEAEASGVIANTGGADDDRPGGGMMERIENLLKTTAICSKYGLNVPFDMVMRLTGLYDARIKDAVSIVAYLEYDESDLGDYSIRFRTRYEASIYLKAFDIGRAEEIEAIVNIIKNMKVDYGYHSENAELRLVVDLLARIGPNSKDFRNSLSRLHLDDYLEIIGALKEYRQNENVVPVLVVQEASYIREYCIEKKKGNAMSDAEIAPLLSDAIEVCSEAILIEEREPRSRSIKNLIVEKVSCKTRMLELALPFTQLDVREYDVIMSELALARRVAPGDPYVINATLWFMVRAYEKLPNDEISRLKKAEIEKSAPNFIDSIRSEYADVTLDSNFTNPANTLLGRIDDALSDDYIGSLIAQQNTSGYYLKAYKALRGAGLSDSRRLSSFTEEEAARCGRICREIFEETPDRQEIARDIKCRRLMLRLKWITYNHKEPFSDNEQLTTMTDEQWREILALCGDHRDCDAETLIFFYFKALACLQLKDYPAFGEAIKAIRDATEHQEFRRTDRVRVRHMLCDSDGVPKLFSGSFNSRMPDDEKSGNYIEITEINRRYNGNRDIYFFKKDFLSSTTFQKGQAYPDFQLGLGYMGLSAYRGFERKAGGSRGSL